MSAMKLPVVVRRRVSGRKLVLHNPFPRRIWVLIKVHSLLVNLDAVKAITFFQILSLRTTSIYLSLYLSLLCIHQ